MRPFLLVSLFVLATVGLAVPLCLVRLVRKRWGMPWRVVGYGALVYLLFQGAIGLPVLEVTRYLLQERLAASPGWRWFELAVAALTAAVFQEGGRWVGYRRWIPTARNWRDGVAFGVGHGSLEMFLLGGLGGLAAAVGYVIYAAVGTEARAPAGLEGALAAARHAYATMPTWLPLLHALERGAWLAIQVTLSVMVLRVFTGGGPGWLALAMGCHALAKFTASVVLERAGPAASALVAVLFAACGLWLLFRSVR